MFNFQYKITTKLDEDYKEGDLVDVFFSDDGFRIRSIAVCRHKTKEQIADEKKQARIATLKAELKELEG